MQHNNVPTTCTASLLTGFNLANLNAPDEKIRVNWRLQYVNELISGGYKKDFAIIHAFTTGKQNTDYGVDDFLKKVGFEPVFVGGKDLAGQRHKETGQLTLWAVAPDHYEASLKAYKAELTEIKDRIDPPKKPDPERQKFEPLLLSKLRKAKMVQDNTAVDNSLRSVMLVSADVLHAHIKMKYGIDVKKFMKVTDERWTNITVRRLKTLQVDWKNELV